MFPIFPLVLIFILGIVAIKLWQRNQAQQKTSNLHNIAQEMGWVVENNGRQALYKQLSYFEVFKRGNWNDIQGVLVGQHEGVDVQVISFRHGSITGIPAEYLILFIEDTRRSLPPLAFRHKKAGFILKNGVTPSQFDVYPSLKKDYVLQGYNLKISTMMLQPGLLDTLSYAVRDGYLLEVETAGTKFLCYHRVKGEGNIKTATVQNLARHGIRIYRQL